MNPTQNARCISCRSEVSVPDGYSDGSQIACSNCGVQLKVIRSGGLRLVIADPLALREELRQLKVDIAALNRDLQTARASWGIGINGLGIGVIYVVAKVALDGRELNRALIVEAVALAFVVGVLLELANSLFLAKRQTVSRLSGQLKQSLLDQRELERKIRESTRR